MVPINRRRKFATRRKELAHGLSRLIVRHDHPPRHLGVVTGEKGDLGWLPCICVAPCWVAHAAHRAEARVVVVRWEVNEATPARIADHQRQRPGERFDGDDNRILRLGLSVANRRKKFFLSRHATRKVLAPPNAHPSSRHELPPDGHDAMIKGLHRNDFIMAAKTDELYGSRAELLLFHPSSR
jgi:hypothetical protein